MTEVYLIEYTRGQGYRKEEEVFSTQQKATALSFIGDVATGKKADVKIASAYKVNLTHGTITKLQPELVDFKLDLVEVKPKAQFIPRPELPGDNLGF